jgi:hypothetical protein
VTVTGLCSSLGEGGESSGNSHCVTPASHHHIITSSHHHIITSSHHHIITSSHHHIITSSHHHIITSHDGNHQWHSETTLLVATGTPVDHYFTALLTHPLTHTLTYHCLHGSNTDPQTPSPPPPPTQQEEPGPPGSCVAPHPVSHTTVISHSLTYSLTHSATNYICRILTHSPLRPHCCDTATTSHETNVCEY